MLKHYSFFILIFFSFLYLANIFSVVSFTLLASKKGKILLLGDCHNHKFDSINKNHINLLLCIANFVNNFDNEVSIDCIYETPTDAFNKYNALSFSDKDNYVLNGSITFVEINKFRVNNPNFNKFNFIASDPRNISISIKISKIFDSILNLFSYFIDKKVEYYKNNKLYKKIKVSLLKDFEDLSAEDYFQDLDKLNFFCAEIINKYSLSDWFSEFKKIYEIFLNDITFVKNVIKEGTFISSLINYIEKNSKISSKAKDLVIELQNIFLNKLNFLPADIGFLDLILESQLKGAQTILIAGDLHVQTVSEVLQSKGYNVLEHESLVTYNKDSALVGEFSPSFHDNYYKSILILLPEDLSAEIQSIVSLMNDSIFQESADKLIVAESDKCLNCNISSSKKKLLYCSRCKKAAYCCKECQKANWPVHKSVCKKFS